MEPAGIIAGAIELGKRILNIHKNHTLPKLAQKAVEVGLIDEEKKPKLAQLLQTYAEADEEVQKEIASEVQNWMNFWVAYEGNPAEQSKVVQILRALPRPFLTFAVGFYCIGWAIFHEGAFPSQQWYWAFMTILGFYFAFRSIEKFRLLKK